jgi:sodium transport system permease protein
MRHEPGELLFDGTRDRSNYARNVLERRLAQWVDTLRVALVEERGLPASFATPAHVEHASIATPGAVGGYLLGRFLPLLLIMMTILGAFYPSIDLAAGEKERGTLEPLLTCRCTRTTSSSASSPRPRSWA